MIRLNAMQYLIPNKKRSNRSRVLLLGAHADDIEIGCGGTILRLKAEYPKADFRWIVFSADGQRRQEAIRSANLFLRGAAGKSVIVEQYRDGYFPCIGGDIKDYFEQLKRDYSPDIVFTHYRHDLHQDHRVICELTWNTFRDHFILEYEVPKYDGDLGAPNFFVALEEKILTKKITNLLSCYQSQAGKHWFCKELFRSLPRLRGMESTGRHKYAEAFYCRKFTV